ncbi:MAG TPA: alkaline phosphatase family protein [Anaerolineaceae bacterium]
MDRMVLRLALCLLLCACAPSTRSTPSPSPTLRPYPTLTTVPLPSPTVTSTLTPAPSPTQPPTPTSTPSPSPTPRRAVPNFDHIFIIAFENKEYDLVIGNSDMPVLNRLAKQYTLLSQYYAIMHPSLPNYMAMIGGDTFGFTTNYPDQPVDAPSLPDLLEASGRTWKTYQESMPAPCGLQDTLLYVQKHNPFVYFASIRNNPARCKAGVVPLGELDRDLQKNTLPHFGFIMPNLCNSSHDCELSVSDQWLAVWGMKLVNAPGFLQNSLLFITWEEGTGEHTCCGLKTGGGRVAAVLVSALVRKGFNDKTPYTHYSLLRTISTAWDLPLLANAAKQEHALIEIPFRP